MDKNDQNRKVTFKEFSNLFHRAGLITKTLPFSPIIVATGLVLMATYPFLLASNQFVVLDELTIYFMWIILAEGWNLVGGYARLLNLGFAAFFVLGSSVANFALISGASLPVALLVAGCSGAILGFVLIPTFRLRSDYFAIGTLVIPLILQPIIALEFGSNYILPSGVTTSPLIRYYAGVIMTTAAIFGIFLLMRSRVGLALRAIGNDEQASSSLGVNIVVYKTIAVVVSGFIASVAGAYYLFLFGSVSSSSFEDLTLSLYPIFMVIIGGIGTFEGPIIGALIFSGIYYTGNTLFPGSTFDVPLFALIIMAVAVLLPLGIAPTLKKLFSKVGWQNPSRS